jgi:iron complex outermembrane receptor protein
MTYRLLHCLSRGFFQLSLLFLPVASASAQHQHHSEEQHSDSAPTLHITADPLSLSLSQSGNAVSVMNAETLTTEIKPTLGETLATEPGVTSSFFGQGASRPVIRGFAGDRVRVMRNGMATQDVSNLSEDHVVTADPLEAESIEVLRGPETLLFGSSAIGGAVNVRDRSIAEAALEKPASGEINGSLGNQASEDKSIATKVDGAIGGLNLHFSGFYRETDDYRIPGGAESSRLIEQEEAEEAEELGEAHSDEEAHEHEEDENRNRVENSDTETRGFTIGGSHVWEKGFFGVAVSGFDSNYGIPGHAHPEGEGHEHEDELTDSHDEDGELEEHALEEGEEEEAVRIDAEQYRFDLRGAFKEVSPQVQAVRYRASVTQYEHDELEGGEVATTYENDAVEGRVEVVHSLLADQKGVVGTQAGFTDFSATGEESFIQPVETISPAVFAFQQVGLSERVRLEFGSRVEFVHHNPESLGSESYVPLSVSLGPVWDLTGDEQYTLGVTLGYNERAPAPVELFADGAHLARQIVEIGDTGLDKESSWGIDLAFRKNQGVVTGSVTPFFQNFTNFINLSDTGEEDDGLPVFTYEEVDAYFWGVEAETSIFLSEIADLYEHEIVLDLQTDWVRARDTDADENLPRIPPLRGISRVRYEYRHWVGTSLEAVFVDSQDKLAESELETDSYTLLNAEAHVHLKPGLEQSNVVTLFVRGNNLGDEEARVHSSFLKDLAPLPGRSLLFGVKGTF